MAFASSPRAHDFGLSAGFSEVLAKWNDARARRAEYIRVFDELNAMSDRDLADINVSRIQIADIARKAAYQV